MATVSGSRHGGDGARRGRPFLFELAVPGGIAMNASRLRRVEALGGDIARWRWRAGARPRARRALACCFGAGRLDAMTLIDERNGRPAAMRGDVRGAGRTRDGVGDDADVAFLGDMFERPTEKRSTAGLAAAPRGEVLHRALRRARGCARCRGLPPIQAASRPRRRRDARRRRAAGRRRRRRARQGLDGGGSASWLSTVEELRGRPPEPRTNPSRHKADDVLFPGRADANLGVFDLSRYVAFAQQLVLRRARPRVPVRSALDRHAPPPPGPRPADPQRRTESHLLTRPARRRWRPDPVGGLFATLLSARWTTASSGWCCSSRSASG